MMLVLIISIMMLAVAMFLLSVKVIFKKNGRFPSSHVGSNVALSKKGISCHTSQHAVSQRARKLEDRIGKI